MQNKFSTFIAISGLVVLSTASFSTNLKNLNSVDKNDDMASKTAVLQVVNTDKKTVIPEWNVGCGNCAG